MAVQNPEFRIAQAVVPGQIQQVVAFLDLVVLDGPHQGEGLGVAAFRGGRKPDVVRTGGHGGLGQRHD